MKEHKVIAWALAVWYSDENGKRRGHVTDWASKPAEDGRITLWENEIDGVGESGLCDSIGTPYPEQDGLFVFECTDATWNSRDGDFDGDADFTGEWRPLNRHEWDSLTDGSTTHIESPFI